MIEDGVILHSCILYAPLFFRKGESSISVYIHKGTHVIIVCIL